MTNRKFLLVIYGAFFLGLSDRGNAAQAITSRTADVEGVKLHYLTAGHGAPVLLLHGYAETSLMWKPLILRLAEHLTVIAPDLPGIGDSSIPEDGLDMKTSAIRIHALVRSLGLQKSEIVGHDIGLMVAYAYAAMYPEETTKLIVMDAFLPGVGGWEAIYNNPGIWHFRFNGPTPEALVRGRERTYFEYFWNDLAADKTRSLPEADRRIYAAAYARQGRMRARLGLLRFLSKGGSRLRGTVSCEAPHAGPVDRRPKIIGGSPRTTDAPGRIECDGNRSSGYWTLDYGGTAKRDDGCHRDVPVSETKSR